MRLIIAFCMGLNASQSAAQIDFQATEKVAAWRQLFPLQPNVVLWHQGVHSPCLAVERLGPDEVKYILVSQGQVTKWRMRGPIVLRLEGHATWQTLLETCGLLPAARKL